MDRCARIKTIVTMKSCRHQTTQCVLLFLYFHLLNSILNGFFVLERCIPKCVAVSTFGKMVSFNFSSIGLCLLSTSALLDCVYFQLQLYWIVSTFNFSSIGLCLLSTSALLDCVYFSVCFPFVWPCSFEVGFYTVHYNYNYMPYWTWFGSVQFNVISFAQAVAPHSMCPIFMHA